MSDTSLNKFLGQGDDAVEGAFTPDPPTTAAEPQPLVLYLNTESTPVLKYWDGDSFEEVPGNTAVASANDKLLGSGNSGSGSPYAELTLGTGLTMSGTTLNASGGSGAIVQMVNTQSGAVATGTTIMPQDNTIPQKTEGDEYMTRAITPTDVANKLRIDVVVNATSTAVGWITAALFQDTTDDALACSGTYQFIATGSANVVFTHWMTAGTTSSTTFKVRAGSNGSGTTTFNGQSSARLYGGVCASSITVTEIVP